MQVHADKSEGVPDRRQLNLFPHIYFSPAAGERQGRQTREGHLARCTSGKAKMQKSLNGHVVCVGVFS